MEVSVEHYTPASLHLSSSLVSELQCNGLIARSHIHCVFLENAQIFLEFGFLPSGKTNEFRLVHFEVMHKLLVTEQLL